MSETRFLVVATWDGYTWRAACPRCGGSKQDYACWTDSGLVHRINNASITSFGWRCSVCDAFVEAECVG
jgi:hypothetical protein